MKTVRDLVKTNRCLRCGRCCLDIGTIFVHSEHPVIKAILDSVPDGYFRDDGPCQMLQIDEDTHRAICLIHKHLGAKWKPEVCRDYPVDEPCFGDKLSSPITEGKGGRHENNPQRLPAIQG
jgi:hypothetical protein